MDPRFPKEREERKKKGREKEREMERQREEKREGKREQEKREKENVLEECSFQENVKFPCSHLSFRAWNFMLQPRSDPGKSMEAMES